MKIVQLAVIATAILLLGACDNNEAGTAAKDKMDSAVAKTEKMMDSAAEKMGDAADKMSASADQVGASANKMGTDVKEAVQSAAAGASRNIDHAKDEVEFGLKRSIAGLESLLEDVKDADQVKAMKQQMAELQAKLDAL